MNSLHCRDALHETKPKAINNASVKLNNAENKDRTVRCPADEFQFRF